MLQKDSLWVGLIIGIAVPAGLFFLFVQIMELAGKPVYADVKEKVELLVLGINVLIMRQFMLKRNQDNIGKGILLVTFIAVIIHFLRFYSHLF